MAEHTPVPEKPIVTDFSEAKLIIETVNGILDLERMLGRELLQPDAKEKLQAWVNSYFPAIYYAVNGESFTSQDYRGEQLLKIGAIAAVQELPLVFQEQFMTEQSDTNPQL